MLETNLKHLETEEELESAVKSNPNVIICCGRMGPMCVPVYGIMEELRPRYPHVVFTDMDFDIPVAMFIKRLPECRSFMGLPFTVYFKGGKVVRATSGIQTTNQMLKIVDEIFPGITQG
ncbi:MAG: thioredoxin family protein [Chitinispirillaceae bacterium]|nr:thioredoxin family protein [Chitinispirillaceae bacterium]